MSYPALAASIENNYTRIGDPACPALGGVDSKDSLLGANQIQDCFWEAVLGVMERLILSDAAWERMAPLIIGRPDQKGSTGRDNRMFVEGVLWIVRTGSPWRDLPATFGDWNSVFRRFSRWSVKGVWWRIFAAMSDDPDFEYLIVDSTIVRAHQHAAGAKKGGLPSAISWECCFSKLKQFRRVATRFEKTARNYLAV